MPDIDRAIRDAEARERRELYRSDGTKLYSDAEHDERRAALRAPIWDAFANQEAEYDRQIAEAKHTLEALSVDDPLDVLDAAQLQKAQALAAFYQDDADRLSPAQLAQRIRAAIAQQDRVKMALLARYGRRRDEAMVAAWTARPGGQGPSDVEARERRQLADALVALDRELTDPKVAQRRASAEQTIKEVTAAKYAARVRRAELDGTADQARAEQAKLYRKF